MIEVRIRHANDTEAVRLCEVPFSEIDSVIPQLGTWGVYLADDGAAFETGELTGQIRVDSVSGRAYFEVIAGTE